MPLRFTAPVIGQHVKTPADNLVETFPKIVIILGVTLPKYAGKVIDDPLIRDGTIMAPPIVPGPGNTWVYSFRTLLDQSFSWQILVPPAPPWISVQTPGATIQKIAKALDKRRLTDGMDFSHVTRVEIVPIPNWHTVRQHIVNHEMQHVVDHKWIADKLYRPVVMMWDSFAIHGGRIVAQSEEILKHVLMGEGEPVSIYHYLNGTHISGRRFHETPRGAWPDLEFAGLSPDGLKAIIHLSHATPMPPVDFHTSLPHAFFKVARSGVKNETEAADPGIRCVLELTQASVDRYEQEAGGADGDDGGDGGEPLEFKW